MYTDVQADTGEKWLYLSISEAKQNAKTKHTKTTAICNEHDVERNEKQNKLLSKL